MSPSFASFLTAVFILYLFQRDIREKSGVSGAIWIPTFWLLIITTRAVTTWLSMVGISAGGVSLEEGSTVDAFFYFVLIAAGFRVLVRRGVSLGWLVRNNRWLVIYLLYCLMATAWSDFPFVAFKRWCKDLGHPIMVLILLTETSTKEALARVLKRCAYVVVPVSILFIKYYPEWGRGFSEWSGEAYNTGITQNKNSLGWDCLILGFFYVWHLLMTLRLPESKTRRNELILTIGFLGMIGWLFSIANSKTPLVALFAALALLAIPGFRWANRRRMGTYILVTVALVGTAEYIFDIYKASLEFLGRDASLTDRAPLWAELMRWGDQNPILGTGFESFWLGERREQIWSIMKWSPSHAHNGYLETYINLGIVGLLLMAGLLLVTFFKVRTALLNDDGFGRFRFAFLFAILVYNWTEASLYGLHPVFFMFFVIAIDYPNPEVVRLEPTLEQFQHETETAAGYADVQG